jgi:hypothetical protein
MLLYLYDGSYMFRQNNSILREQLGFFQSYFNVNMVGGKSWNVWYRPMFLQEPNSLYALGSISSQFTA